LLSLSSSKQLTDSFAAITQHEQTLIAPLLEYLTDKSQYEKGVRVVGEEASGPGRAPTISFIVQGRSSKDIVKAFDKTGKVVPFLDLSFQVEVTDISHRQMGIRYGHFYAFTLLSELEPKVDPEDGVVRVSLVHYNTVEEVERIIEVFKSVL